MDLELLQRFLVITREGTISRAAETLHISQPALSRQMKDLEDFLGVTLFERGHRKITLTHEGMILRKRANELLSLMQLTESELTQAKDHYAGDIYVGAGESLAFHCISQIISRMQKQYPDIHFHIRSGDTEDLQDLLERGLVDFAFTFNDYDEDVYHGVPLPGLDHFGVMMPKNHPLAAKEIITNKDLYQYPLIMSRATSPHTFPTLDFSRLQIAATYNLIYNASLMVEDGVGLALCFRELINVTGESQLAIRPMQDTITAHGAIIWKKYQVFPAATQLFIKELEKLIV